jgi:hypothetical protein
MSSNVLGFMHPPPHMTYDSHASSSLTFENVLANMPLATMPPPTLGQLMPYLGQLIPLWANYSHTLGQRGLSYGGSAITAQTVRAQTCWIGRCDVPLAVWSGASKGGGGYMLYEDTYHIHGLEGAMCLWLSRQVRRSNTLATH